jgi:cytochrome oxidase Cu insertion factor (SCO1/SenC/PrrC family)
MEQANKNPRKNWIQIRGLWLLVSACTVLMLSLISLMLASRIYRSTRKMESPKLAPGFLLHDELGRPTSLAQFRGKVVLLTFVDPVCTQVCPNTTHSMTEALRILGPAAASQVQLLGINANPSMTELSDVAAYTRLHKLEGNWRFLTGSRAELENVWRAYNVYIAIEKDDLEHSTDVILIDADGKQRDSFTAPMSYEVINDQAHMLATAIAQLLPGHPHIPTSASNSQQQEVSAGATATVDLLAIGPKQQHVVLGRDQPHLLLFFACWLGENPEMSKDLAVLDSYRTLAIRKGWPSPVAVDELTTESSPEEARQALAPLAATLHTPIVEDDSGRLADDSHVDDMPWFVLTSASGDILWHHYGWLSVTELNRQVRAALAGR